MDDIAQNQEVLDRLQADGDDLQVAREIDFAHLFVTEAEARCFAEAAIGLGFDAAVQECDDEAAWDVIASKKMIPSAHVITTEEARLDRLARCFGGQADGWGCLAVK